VPLKTRLKLRVKTDCGRGLVKLEMCVGGINLRINNLLSFQVLVRDFLLYGNLNPGLVEKQLE